MHVMHHSNCVVVIGIVTFRLKNKVQQEIWITPESLQALNDVAGIQLI